MGAFTNTFSNGLFQLGSNTSILDALSINIDGTEFYITMNFDGIENYITI